MIDETAFRRHADAALQRLKKSLIQTESNTEFEVEEQNGALTITLEKPQSQFVLTPNIPMRQIWISGSATGLQLDWNEMKQSFVLARTGETLLPLMTRLMREHQE